jgi:plastocyanin
VIGVQRTLLGFGIGAVGIAIFGFVVLALFGLDSSPSWGTFRFPHDSATSSMPPTGGMGPGMMGGFWTDASDAAPVEPAFPEADELTVQMDDFAFAPSDITVQAGQVNLTLVNAGAAEHDLTVPALDIRILVVPGKSGTIGLEFDTPGTYDTLCSIPGHASLGMTGSLIVLPRT